MHNYPITKISLGRLRPDFRERCAPVDKGNGQVNCSGDAIVIREGRKSFPSGHTSSMQLHLTIIELACFAGLGYSSLYVGGQIKVFDKNGYVFKVILFLLPWIIAALVGVSRIIDYRHHGIDGINQV